MALPMLDAPRMVLWTSPPGPDSAIGNYADWAEDLIVHEDLHNVHLLQPSRNPLRRLGERLLPVGPVATRAPRWVHEGYATLVEGKLTAMGRPNGDIRASILRRWATAGRLPSYGQMSSDSQSFLGMSMAYLVGSAYLEWLVERTGPDSLRHLWARLTARTNRSFDKAFEGVFGDAPARLYGRFTAELTLAGDGGRAQDRGHPAGRRALAGPRVGDRGAGGCRRDGSRVAIVRRSREGASRIVVWSTAPDPEAEKKWQQRVDTALARDPLDIAPVRGKPLGRTPLFELVTRSGAEPSSLRFMPDGKALLFVRFEPDRDGFLHPDLFLWSLEGGEVQRLTTLADVRAADPSPDGTWAAGVRHRHGLSQLVRVELATGAVTELTPALRGGGLGVAACQPRRRQPGGDVPSGRPLAHPRALAVRRCRAGGGDAGRVARRPPRLAARRAVTVGDVRAGRARQRRPAEPRRGGRPAARDALGGGLPGARTDARREGVLSRPGARRARPARRLARPRVGPAGGRHRDHARPGCPPGPAAGAGAVPAGHGGAREALRHRAAGAARAGRRGHGPLGGAPWSSACASGTSSGGSPRLPWARSVATAALPAARSPRRGGAGPWRSASTPSRQRHDRRSRPTLRRGSARGSTPGAPASRRGWGGTACGGRAG
ncbi:MAG: TolB family protein [Thermoanaerobaculaceae bacterium]